MRCSLFSFLKPLISFKLPLFPLKYVEYSSRDEQNNLTCDIQNIPIFWWGLRLRIFSHQLPTCSYKTQVFWQKNCIFLQFCLFRKFFSNFRIGSFAFVWLYDHVYSTIVLYPITHINIVHRIPNNKRTFSGMKIDFFVLFALSSFWEYVILHKENLKYFYPMQIFDFFFVVSKWTVL